MASFGSGRGRGRGRGRDSNRSGRGGPPTHNAPGESPKLQLCRNFASGANCHHGERCNFAHVVKLHACTEASDKNKDNSSRQNQNNYSRGYAGSSHGKAKDNHRVTSVAVWETNGMIKIFTGSHDGKWRLWNTAPSSSGNGAATLTKEFEHFVGGPVDAVHVAAHYFFCGFEASPTEAPDAKAGMVHSWNLNAASDPPMELMMSPMSKYASSGRIRSLFTTPDGRVWSGGSDGAIRQWAFNPSGGPGGQAAFTLVRTMSGHLGAVTGLALTKGHLWSGGADGTLRLWDVETGAEAHLISAVKKDAAANTGGGVSPPPTGHSEQITGLIPFEAPGDKSPFVFSSSFDQTVKVWNAANGECVASENHGQGVTAIAVTTDTKGTPLLLCGLQYGDIMIRGTVSNPPLILMLKISHKYLQFGHNMGPVNDIRAGPNNTFYTVADDGQLMVWQITGDFGL